MLNDILPYTVNKAKLAEIKLPEQIVKNLEDLNKKEDEKEISDPIKENLEAVKELMKDEDCKE